GRRADRDDLLAAGPRPADGRFDPVARLSGGAGRRALHRGRLRAGEPRGRPLLLLARSADQARVTSAGNTLRVGAETGRRGAARDRWYSPLARVLRRSSAKFGLAITLAFLLLTVAAPLIAPHDPYE